MRNPFRPTLLGAFFILLALGSARSPTESAAQGYSPDLGEVLDWLAPRGSMINAPPAGAPELARYPMAPQGIERIRDELPGRPFGDLENPPRSRSWWKYPIYGVLGFPRDFIDGFFGLIAYVPLINVPVVGGVYELVPMQVFFRDPRDWHRWPGQANRNGHGFLPGKIKVRDYREGKDPMAGTHRAVEDDVFYEGWGWFPTLNSTKFTYVNKRTLARMEAENLQIREELLALNRVIETNNRAIAEHRRQTREAAITAIDAGDGAEAVSRMLPYYLAYPVDETAHALLINSLALYSETGPEWVRPYLWHQLSTTNLRVLRQSETLIETSNRAFPEAVSLTEALVFARSRFEEKQSALEAAEASYVLDPADPRRVRLLFETALSARDEESALRAIEGLDDAAPSDEQRQRFRLRLNLLQNTTMAETRLRFSELAEREPENAYFHYYLACAALAMVDESDQPFAAIQMVFEELEKASLLAPVAPLGERVGRALNYTRTLISGEFEREEQPESTSLLPTFGAGGDPNND